MLFLETFPPQQSCFSIFLDLVIQNSHFLLYSDLYTMFSFHFCFQFILWLWAKLFNVSLLFPLSLSIHHVLSGTVLNRKKEHFNCKHVGFGSRWSFNLQLYNRRRFCRQDITECCTSEGTVGARLAPLPAQIRSLDGHEVLPVARNVLLCFWLDFSMLYSPLCRLK